MVVCVSDKPSILELANLLSSLAKIRLPKTYRTLIGGNLFNEIDINLRLVEMCLRDRTHHVLYIPYQSL
jgi:hypothetical protein